MKANLGAYADLLREPADRALARLLAEGPKTLATLALVLRRAPGTLSARLAGLARLGLVVERREGRQRVFALGEPGLAQAVREALPEGPAVPAVVAARTCYDHLAGKAGVALFDALVRLGAVREPGALVAKGAGRKTPVAPGPNAADVFAGLGIDLDSLARAPGRRFAFACLDWTERRAHLGGALGAALLRRFAHEGWVRREAGTRAVTITSAGRRALRSRLGLTAPLPDA